MTIRQADIKKIEATNLRFMKAIDDMRNTLTTKNLINFYLNASPKKLMALASFCDLVMNQIRAEEK